MSDMEKYAKAVTARIPIIRGGIYVADLGDSDSDIERHTIRPIVVVQNDTGNQYSPSVIIASVTTVQRKYYPMHQDIKLERDSTILYEKLITLDKDKILSKIRNFTPEEQLESDKRLMFSIGVLHLSILSVAGVQVYKRMVEETKGKPDQVYLYLGVLYEDKPDATLKVLLSDLDGLNIKRDTPLEDIELILNTFKGVKKVVKLLYTCQ